MSFTPSSTFDRRANWFTVCCRPEGLVSCSVVQQHSPTRSSQTPSNIAHTISCHTDGLQSTSGHWNAVMLRSSSRWIWQAYTVWLDQVYRFRLKCRKSTILPTSLPFRLKIGVFMLGSAESEMVRLISRENILQNSNLYDHDTSDPQRYRRSDNLPWQ